MNRKGADLDLHRFDGLGPDEARIEREEPWEERHPKQLPRLPRDWSGSVSLWRSDGRSGGGVALLAGSLLWSRIANSKPQPPGHRIAVFAFWRQRLSGPPQAIGGGTGRSRRGLREATYNGAGVWSWKSGLSATQSIRSDPLKTAKNHHFWPRLPCLKVVRPCFAFSGPTSQTTS